MTTQSVTLTNDFHGTATRIRAEVMGDGHYRANPSQVARASRALCGMSDCHCSTIRGRQSVHIEERADGGLDFYAHAAH